MNRLDSRSSPHFALFVLILLLWSSPPLLAQKKPLDHDAYEIWNLVKARVLSADGGWAAWVQGPDNGDNVLLVRETSGGVRHRIPRGEGPRFSAEGESVVFLIKPPRDSVRQAKIAKKKKEEMPKDSLGILSLSTGQIERFAGVKSFALSEEAGSLLAVHLEKPAPVVDSAGTGASNPAPDSAGTENGKAKRKKELGTPLVIRQIETGSERRIEHAVEYAPAPAGTLVAYVLSTGRPDEDGVCVLRADSLAAAPQCVFSGPGTAMTLVWDESDQLAFLAQPGDSTSEKSPWALFHWRPGLDRAVAVAESGTDGMPEDWGISEHGSVSFSKDGMRLYFGSAPPPLPEPEENLPDDERVDLDVWTWTDPLIQPMQLKQAEAERKRSYRAVVHLDRIGKVVQLADFKVPEVHIGAFGDADFGLGYSDGAYRELVLWDYPSYRDVFVVEVSTGERSLVIERAQWAAELSPDGRYVAWWDGVGRAWFARSVQGGEPVNLTGALPVAFHDEAHDLPHPPPAYGSAGWLENGRGFVVYDRTDLWLLDPAGNEQARCITEGYGRAVGRVLRMVKLDPESLFLTEDESLLLAGRDLKDKSAGFYRDRIAGDAKPSQLLWMPRRFSTPVRAEKADVLLFTRETVDEFPDLWTSDVDFRRPVRLSHANPQQAAYLWPTVELIDWISNDGERIEGLLYKPEGFLEGARYPMVVYFYERNAENLHQHPPQVPHRSVINPIFYASRGYLVFIPDIPYRTGYPGESAYNAILPGVTALIERGMANPDRIALQGHSWGGYQIAYLVTRTRLFKAAAAGAPVANMVSAYGGIRWESGMARMFQYERTQSRIGGSLWEKPLLYIENSPIFWADKIETPVLIMHNDHDGAVPWYQGIEFYLALRRLGKPAWLLNYSGEPHWPLPFAKRKDWQIRLQQYLDYYLFDAPAPFWMTRGVPAVEKGIQLGLETVPVVGDE